MRVPGGVSAGDGSFVLGLDPDIELERPTELELGALDASGSLLAERLKARLLPNMAPYVRAAALWHERAAIAAGQPLSPRGALCVCSGGFLLWMDGSWTSH